MNKYSFLTGATFPSSKDVYCACGKNCKALFNSFYTRTTKYRGIIHVLMIHSAWVAQVFFPCLNLKVSRYLREVYTNWRRSRIVYIEWASRVNFVTSFGDVYKNKLWVMCNNLDQFAHLSSASVPSNDVIKMAAIVLLMYTYKTSYLKE